MVQLLRLSILLFLLLLQGCVSRPGLLTQSIQPFNSAQWQDYGAVYEYDELRIEEKYDDGYGAGFDTWYTYNQKLHIINRKGVDYGTISIPRLTDEITNFEVQLIQDTGEVVELDLTELQQKYIDTGKIAVPKVQPGSTISTTVTFREQEPLIRFEYSFNRDLPVLLGQFSVFPSFETEYAVRTYNIGEEDGSENFSEKNGIIVKQENYLPQEDWGWKGGLVSEGYSYAHYPKVAVSIKRFRSSFENYNGRNWKEYAQEYRNFILDTAFTSSQSELAKIVRGLENEYPEDYARADAILQYVQDNITVTESGKRDKYAVDIDQVITRKSGDYLEISVVLMEMLKMAGFDIALYVTRSRKSGGFDPELPGWGQLSMPLVSAVIENKELIGYPFLRNASFGEYPRYFHDEKALQLDSGEIVDLPEPIKNKNIFASNVIFTPLEGKNEIDWRCSLNESMGLFARDYIPDYNEQERKRYWKKIIKKFDGLNVPEGQPVLTVKRGEPLLLQGKVQNQNVTVTKPGNQYVNLGVFFREYFQKAVDSRTQPYINDLELLYEEMVTLPTEGSGRVTYDFLCENMDNLLFRSECSTDIGSGKHQLIRKVTFKKVSIPAESWSDYIGEIKKLNEISKSNMVRKI